MSNPVDGLMKKVIGFVRRELGEVEGYIIKEGKSRITVLIFVGNNPSGIRTIKLVFNKNNRSVRVYSRARSFDLRLKKFISRILEGAFDEGIAA